MNMHVQYSMMNHYIAGVKTIIIASIQYTSVLIMIILMAVGIATGILLLNQVPHQEGLPYQSV
jgi:hypothetical protein